MKFTLILWLISSFDVIGAGKYKYSYKKSIDKKKRQFEYF